MKQHLVKHRAKHVAIARSLDSGLDSLRNSATERTRCARMVGKNLAANLSGHAGRRSDIGTICAHHFATERFLLVRHLYHEDLAVEVEVRTSHTQCRTPLAGTGLGGHTLQTLCLGIISLGDGRVEFVRTRGVVTLELIVNLGRRSERLLQEVGSNEW